MPADITASAEQLSSRAGSSVLPGSFDARRHFYPRAVNAQIHPLVAFVLRMSKERLAQRYCHLHPRVSPDLLAALLRYTPSHFRWAGCDLFCTTTAAGNRRLVVIETNSCPSGNKSMPLQSEDDELGGYRTLLERTFLPLLADEPAAHGELAVLFDKNHMEASGYAAALADLTGERVWLVPWTDGTVDAPARFTDGVLHVRDDALAWHPVRAAFRYVTQRPWCRIPVATRTRIVNPVITCLAGGRNKLVAAKAYQIYNGELASTGLQIRTPKTVTDVAKQEVPLWVRRFGGQAVVKVPYCNAGQGVYTIVDPQELAAFMAIEHPYQRFIVQSLIGNYTWSTGEHSGRYYHVGTMPDRRGDIYVADLRVMVAAGPAGFEPVAIYARRARSPLSRSLPEPGTSWDVLGTNLSEKRDDGGWAAETDRLLLMDRRDFHSVGIGADDLIEAYIQTVLAAIAIDRMASHLLAPTGELSLGLFASLDHDDDLLREVRLGNLDQLAV